MYKLINARIGIAHNPRNVGLCFIMQRLRHLSTNASRVRRAAPLAGHRLDRFRQRG